MARKAVAVAVLIYYVVLLSPVCGMPPTQSGSMSPPPRALHGGRVQCPVCLRYFKSETGLRHHRGALGRLGLITSQTGCAVDTRQPLISEWIGEGRGAAGTVRNLAQQSVHLPGMTDSDSDGERREERPDHHAPDAGGPGEEPEEDEQLPDVVAPLPPVPVQIHNHTYTYMHIRTNTYDTYSIHTHTYSYMHICTCINILISM